MEDRWMWENSLPFKAFTLFILVFYSLPYRRSYKNYEPSYLRSFHVLPHALLTVWVFCYDRDLCKDISLGCPHWNTGLIGNLFMISVSLLPQPSRRLTDTLISINVLNLQISYSRFIWLCDTNQLYMRGSTGAPHIWRRHPECVKWILYALTYNYLILIG